jgi:hypothetical protein
MGENSSGFEKLNDSNWGVWKMLMRALLVRKNLWDIMDGSEVLPAPTNLNAKAIRAFRKKQAEALAEIVLHVEVAQLSFIQDDDPAIVWEALAAVHQARGMATRLTLRRRFWRLQKPEGPMQNFIAETRRLANQLADIGVTVYDEDIILVLTGGLPPSYENFVISLDATPLAQLTLDYVITRLLNEETRQVGATIPVVTESNLDAAFAAYLNRRSRDLAQIICYNCGKKGHFQSSCQEPKKETAAIAATTFIDSELDVAW